MCVCLCVCYQYILIQTHPWLKRINLGVTVSVNAFKAPLTRCTWRSQSQQAATTSKWLKVTLVVVSFSLKAGVIASKNSAMRILTAAKRMMSLVMKESFVAQLLSMSFHSSVFLSSHSLVADLTVFKISASAAQKKICLFFLCSV